jgi:hypothetical protein
MNPVWESVRMTVCRKCIDGNAKGECRLPDGEICSLERFFPDVSSAIASADVHSMDAIARAMRASVCRQCPYGTPEHCTKRDTLECALERHLPLVVERVIGMNMKSYS